MSNLFSSFEPSALTGLPLNWLSMLSILLVAPSLFWMKQSQAMIFLNMLISYIWKEFKTILNPNSTPGFLILALALFVFIIMNNFFGLFPYTFTASSHLTFSVTLALPLWVGHMTLAILKTPQAMLAHLVPLGTPVALMPLMVIIEMISSSIRPLTLSVRLAANMIAGHLLLTLLASGSIDTQPMILMAVIIALLLLAVLESAVSMIQAYVFSVLSTLYINEVNSAKMN